MLDGAVALDQARDYYDSVVHYDIQGTDGVDRDPERVKLLMRSYARHQGAAVNFSMICVCSQTRWTESCITIGIRMDWSVMLCCIGVTGRTD